MRSVIAVVLKRAKSQLAMPAPRIVGSRRPAVPNANAGGGVKHEVLNNWLSLDCAEPATDLSQPATTFGREPPPKELVRLEFVVSPKGNPDWNVETPLTPHPETSLSANPLTLPRIVRLLPTGRSST